MSKSIGIIKKATSFVAFLTASATIFNIIVLRSCMP
jgi:hypothetical protein